MVIYGKTIDILIVDDENDVRDTCVKYVSNMELFRNIIEAKDGIEASAKLSNQTFEVIVLDINLPKKDAFGILKHFKELAPQVIIISGGLGAIAAKRAIALGVKHFLVKPFDEESLKSKINLILKRKK